MPGFSHRSAGCERKPMVAHLIVREQPHRPSGALLRTPQDGRATGELGNRSL